MTKRLVNGELVDVSDAEMAEQIASFPPVSSAAQIEPYRLAAQAHLDITARTRGYESGVTCASYAGSTNAQWAAEAAAFVAWRDAVWGYSYGELAKVQAGQREQPGVDELLGELPAISWPV